MNNDDTRAALAFHAATKYRADIDAAGQVEYLMGTPPTLEDPIWQQDWSIEPRPYKRYTTLAPLPLPSDIAPTALPALATLARTGEEGTGSPEQREQVLNPPAGGTPLASTGSGANASAESARRSDDATAPPGSVDPSSEATTSAESVRRSANVTPSAGSVRRIDATSAAAESVHPTADATGTAEFVRSSADATASAESARRRDDATAAGAAAGAGPGAVARGGLVDLAALARLARLCNGLLNRRVNSQTRGVVEFRTAGGTGARYHLELYFVCGDLPDLAAGVYHYATDDHSLRQLRGGDLRGAVVEASGNAPRLAQAPVILAMTSTFWRNAWRYKARAYRHTYWDTGTSLANLLAVAASLEVPTELVLGYADAGINALLGVDGESEATVALCAAWQRRQRSTCTGNHLEHRPPDRARLERRSHLR